MTGKAIDLRRVFHGSPAMKRTERLGALLSLVLFACLTTGVLAETKHESDSETTAAKKKSAGSSQSVACEKEEADEGDSDRKAKQAEKKRQEDGQEPETEILPDLTDFYAEIADVAKLNKKEQKKLLEVQKQKIKTLEKFDKIYDRKIVAIENALDRTDKEKQREKLRAELKKIERSREVLEQKFDNKALSTLTSEQRIVWNAYELWNVLSPDLEFDEDPLRDEQVDKAQAICRQIAEKMGAKGRIAQNPAAQKTALALIGRSVLTPKQRAAYARQQRRKRIVESGHDGAVLRRHR